jgi:alginate O-acetyltransferase complex protein AlgI
MNFNTSHFALFAIVVASLYLLLHRRTDVWAQNAMLLVASYYFYGSWDHKFLFLILVSTVVDFVCGLAIVGERPRRAQRVSLVMGSLVGCLVLLAPVDWVAVFEAIRPSAAFDGGWSSRSDSLSLLTASPDWVQVGAGLAALAVIWISVTIGYKVGVARRRKYFVALSVTTNLTILGFFKYFDFFVSSAAAGLSSIGIPVREWELGIIVPVGISFYTFQTLSYTIDIYRGTLQPTRNLANFALFVAFFPQLVAGPIERAKVLLPQIEASRTLSWTGLQSGVYLIGWGLFKKIYIADNLARFVDPVYGIPETLDGPTVLLGTYAFALQIYCDFSAYSDIARGISRCFGIELMVNFNVPYAASNPQEFWRRWHISLSTWLRDYLYISLGGSKKGTFAEYRNLMLTMVLGGLWHGASANFVLWGVYQGGLLCLHRALRPFLKAIQPTNEFLKHVLALFCWVCFFHFVCYGWLLFRAESWNEIALLTASLGIGWENTHEHFGVLARLLMYCTALVAVEVAQFRSGNLLVVLKWSWPIRAMFYLVLFYLTIVLGEFGKIEFIYFQF